MKVLTIDVAEVLKEPGGGGYKFYSWLSKQFNGSIIVEAGTCRGKSAKCFSSNPSNLVITYDILKGSRSKGRLDPISNVVVKQLDANKIDPQWFSKVDVLFVDISHNGDDEALFLDRIEPYFKGILVMDDVNHPHFTKLSDLFNSITREKHLLKGDEPGKIGMTRGTGVVCYGDWTIEIKEES
jgi:hypothetical protein